MRRKKRPGRVSWPPEMIEEAKKIYVRYGKPNASEREIILHVRRMLIQQYTRAPSERTLYTWVEKYNWKEERRRYWASRAVDEAAEIIAKNTPVETLSPQELVQLAIALVKQDLENSEIDHQVINEVTARLLDATKNTKNPRELAAALTAISEATKSKLTRGATAIRFLQAIAQAIQVQAEAMQGHICPALKNPDAPIPENCPLLKRLGDESIRGD